MQTAVLPEMAFPSPHAHTCKEALEGDSAPHTLPGQGFQLCLKHSALAPKPPEHWGAVWSPHTEPGAGGTSLIFVFELCCGVQALKPGFPFATTKWNSSTVHLQPSVPSAAWSASLKQLNCHRLLHRCAGKQSQSFALEISCGNWCLCG